MIRRLVILFVLAFFVAAALGCGGKRISGSGIATERVTPSDIDKNLRYFLGVDDEQGNEVCTDGTIGDRYPASVSENAAAKKLAEHFGNKEKYGSLRVTDLNSTMFLSDDKASYNVEIKLDNPYYNGSNRVLVTASYDNPYKMGVENIGDYAIGAFAATGTAAVMSIIDHMCGKGQSALKNMDFNVTFVFFGSSYVNATGISRYLTDTVTAEELGNTIAAFDLNNFGGDRLYLYCDDIKTEREELFKNAVAECGAECYTLPVNMPIIDGAYKSGVYFAHSVMFGNSTEFSERGIASFKLFSGYYGGFNLSPIEKRGDVNVLGTYRDTYANLKEKRSAFSRQGSDAASSVISALSHSGFSQSVSGNKSVYDYGFALNPMWAYIIELGILIALGVTVAVLVKKFEKKYPYKPVVKRMRVAVFGMEYEDPRSGDLYIDVKSKNPFEDY